MSDDEQAGDERPREQRDPFFAHAPEGPLRPLAHPEPAPYDRVADRASPYPVSRLSGPISLVDAAREIEHADQWIASTSESKLVLIAAQMHALRRQAEQVLAEAQQNATLHRAEARFQRHPGKTYHLYQRADGQRYWSMLAPADWAGQPPHVSLGSYRLEADQSWTPIERTAERDQRRLPVADWLEQRLLGDAGATLRPSTQPPHTSPSTSSVRSRAEEPRAAPPTDLGSERKDSCESS